MIRFWKKKVTPVASGFNFDIWLKEFLLAAEKEGFSLETMAQIRLDAEKIKFRAKIDEIRLKGLLRELGVPV